MQHIQRMIDQHGGFEAVRTRYLRLENPPFMRLVIEVIGGPYPNGAYELSIAHYSEQNGDAMRDPEITFLVALAEQGTTWTPLTFENSYLSCYQVVAQVTPAGLVEAREPSLMRDLRDFATQWDRNLKQQGFMAVFERQYGDQNGATHAATVTRPRGDRLNADS
uniref:DUF6908 domain-containing protein n=1 Tax=Prosthecobacter sp. TaxID=1965333 RepID=UPI003782F67D